MRRFWKATGILVGIAAILLLLLQLALNMPFVSRTADKYAGELIDGNLQFSRLRFSAISRFPKFIVSVDSVSLTYPHERFAAYDHPAVSSPYLEAGRGPEADTLIRFDHFTASVNPFKLLSGDIKVGDVSLEGLAVYAHKYGDTANWEMFRTSAKEEKDTASSLPWISVGGVAFDDTRLVYTAQEDTVFVCGTFHDFHVKGAVKADMQNGTFRYHNVRVNLDSLHAVGRLPSNLLDLSLDYLDVVNTYRQALDLTLNSRVSVFTDSWGEISVPVDLKGRLDVDQRHGELGLEAVGLCADIAYVPICLDGSFNLGDDGKEMDLHALIDNCDLGRVVREFSTQLPILTNYVKTNAHLTLSADACGTLSEEEVPAIDVSLKIPDAYLRYKPMSMDALVGVEASASMSESKSLRADVKRLAVLAPGVKMTASGAADQLLSKNPQFNVKLDGYAVADSVYRYIPKGMDMKAGGNVALNLKAKTNLKEISTLRFYNSVIEGKVSGDSLVFAMPADTLNVTATRPDLHLTSSPDGLNLLVNMDKAFVNKGDSLHVRVRNTKNDFRMFTIEESGESLPKLSFNTDSRMIYLKAGVNRFGLFGAKLGASIQMRPRKAEINRKRFLDSLHRANPGVPVDSLIILSIRERKGNVPNFLRPDDFSDHDIVINTDSVINSYFKKWNPAGYANFKFGFVSTPVYPLRTHLTDVDLTFTDNEIDVNDFKVVSGMSDVSLKCKVRGLRRALMSKGFIRADIDVNSNRFNINELVTALDIGTRTKDVDSDTLSETEGSYVIDSIADAKLIKKEVPLLIIPANLDLKFNVNAGQLTVADVDIAPVAAALTVKDRTAQVIDCVASTKVGGMTADAFYSTKSKKDISLGADLRLRDISADGVIHMLPTVDKMIPLLKSFEGLFDIDLSVASQLDTNMNLIIPTLEGITRIRGNNLNISDVGDLKKITTLLLFKDKNIGRIEDLKVDAAVHDSRLEVFPFELSADRYKFVLRGTQGPDSQMNYHASVVKSPFLIPFGINVYGYTDNWRFFIGLPKYRAGRVPAYTKQLDTVQINIHQSIRDVFRRGIEDIRREARKSSRLAMNSEQDAIQLGDVLTGDGVQQTDSLMLLMAEAIADRELEQEVEDAILSSPIDLEGVIMEYDTTKQDAMIERRIKRLKKKH